MPFGVDLPDNLGSETNTEAAAAEPTGAEQPKDFEVSRTAGKSEAPKDILDLDKLERFRFAGREWSPKDLKSAYLRHEDYTKKTTEVSEARKYTDNFTHDLQTVLSNPARMAEFRKVYPKDYVAVAEKILEKVSSPSGRPQDTSDTTRPKDDPLMQKVSSLEEKLSQWEQREVGQIQSWLDNQYEILTKKYPYANPELVTARAEALSAKGQDITKDTLDKLFRTVDTETKERWDKMYKGKVQEQIKAGSKAKDTGTGGGIPGGAPRGFKTIKEATNAFLDDIAASKR